MGFEPCQNRFLSEKKNSATHVFFHINNVTDLRSLEWTLYINIKHAFVGLILCIYLKITFVDFIFGLEDIGQ